jgi:DNA-binding CsgD family transcriptional regulator
LERTPDVQFTAAAVATKVEAEIYAGRASEAADVAREAIRRVSTLDSVIHHSLLGLLAFGTVAEAQRALIGGATADRATVDSARGAADDYRQRLRSLASGRSADDGDSSRYASWANAEYSRIDGPPNPNGWAAVRTSWSEAGRPYFAAYAGYREAEAALEAHRPKPEAAAPLREAHVIAAQLGARPLLAWIDNLAQRARINLGQATEKAAGRQATDSADLRSAADIALDRFGLTRREREILALLAAGWTNRRIADALFISESTAGVHVSNILGKLGVANRVEAASLAARLGVELPVAEDRP